MAFSIFIDALPFTEVDTRYRDWIENEQYAKLIPNIAYSSVLHWQLYCNKYPDERMRFVDWEKQPEKSMSVRVISNMLRPIDSIKPISFLVRKSFDRFVFRRNALANVPFRFRSDFSEQSEYLFWNKDTYSKEKNFWNYDVISQDEGHHSFEETYEKAKTTISSGETNIFLCIGEIDHQGHICARGAEYSKRIRKYMDSIKELIIQYLSLNPNEEILIVSDHGMSTVKQYVDFKLEKQFGKQGKDTYIAYTDSCVMCIWSDNEQLKREIREFLAEKSEGHLLSDDERKYYKASNKLFGDLVFILKEGNCFKNSWFGCSIRKHPDGEGMHGFWPEIEAKDQMASIILINGRRVLKRIYTYSEAYELISSVMQGY